MSNSAINGAAFSWVSTDEAARELQMHPNTLRRLRDSDQGLLPDVHYRRGIYQNSPVKWNVAAVRELIVRNAFAAGSDNSEAI